jgi:hypothetical protein
MSDVDNAICAGCQTKGLLTQLYAFFESHANLAKHFYQRLFPDCKYPLPHIPRGYSDWFGACYVCDCSGKSLLLLLWNCAVVLAFHQLLMILNKNEPNMV